jgi:molybdate transport system substrate-binding protein
MHGVAGCPLRRQIYRQLVQPHHGVTDGIHGKGPRRVAGRSIVEDQPAHQSGRIINGQVHQPAFKLEGKSMSNSRLKKLALGLSAALTMAWSPVSAQIQVVVSPTLVTPVNDIINAFQAHYFTNYNINYNVGLNFTSTTGDIVSQITQGSNFDLFLSSSEEEPEYLDRHYRHRVIGEPFAFAEDTVSLYARSVDVTKGLPFPLTTNFVIPDPTTDNYGEAAARILASWPWKIQPSQIPGGFVAILVSGATGSYVQVKLLRHYQYGFTAKSQFCRYANDVGFTYPPGSSHFDYEPHDPAHPYSAKLVTQMGIVLAQKRTADQKTELRNFLSFLFGTPDSYGVSNPEGPAILESYCYKLRQHHGWKEREAGEGH